MDSEAAQRETFVSYPETFKETPSVTRMDEGSSSTFFFTNNSPYIPSFPHLPQQYIPIYEGFSLPPFPDSFIINTNIMEQTPYIPSFPHPPQQYIPTDDGFSLPPFPETFVPNSNIFDETAYIPSYQNIPIEDGFNRSDDGLLSSVCRIEKESKKFGDKNPDLVKGPFSPEEDRVPVEFVETHGVGNWSTIAQLHRQTGNKCMERRLHHNFYKNPWSEEEDRILMEAHQRLGNRWSEISLTLPGRSYHAVKNRWYDSTRRMLLLDMCESNSYRVDLSNKWSEEEERILIEAHQRLGNRWVKISRSLPGRSAKAVRCHWKKLKNSTSENYSPLCNYGQTRLISSAASTSTNTPPPTATPTTAVPGEHVQQDVMEMLLDGYI